MTSADSARERKETNHTAFYRASEHYTGSNIPLGVKGCIMFLELMTAERIFSNDWLLSAGSCLGRAHLRTVFENTLPHKLNK